MAWTMRRQFVALCAVAAVQLACSWWWSWTIAGETTHETSEQQHADDIETDLPKCFIVPTCESKKWAVVATSRSSPTEAVRRFIYRKEWCVVVVGVAAALETKEPYGFNHTGQGENIIFLDAEDQDKFMFRLVGVGLSSGFERKNLGYLYAIAAGAEVIFDMDDETLLKFWMKGASPDPLLELDSFADETGSINVLRPYPQAGFPEFNPYNLLGCPVRPCWPRGYPHRSIRKPVDVSRPSKRETIKHGELAVLQSLGDHHPDVDAVFRLSQGLPMSFEKKSSRKIDPTHRVDMPVVLPDGVFSPMNAHGSLHYKSAFFALFLPGQLHNRVADIWRSYIGQSIFRVLGLKIGYLPRPLLVWDRQSHPEFADVDGEIPLYEKAGELVNFLSKWTKETLQSTERTELVMVERLYKELSDRAFIASNDVEQLKLWLTALQSIKECKMSHEQDYAPSMHCLKIGKTSSAPESTFQDSLPGSCETIRSGLNFWTSDLHPGPRVDTPSVLAHLGQNVYEASILADNFINKEDFFKAVDKSPGSVTVVQDLSPLLNIWNTPRPRDIMRGNWSMYEKPHFLHYKKSKRMTLVNVIVCTFVPALCLFQRRLNKSIAYIPSHRYNLHVCSVDKWHELNNWLRYLDKDVSRPHLLGGMDRYDVEYMKYYTGIQDLKLVSTLSGFYATSDKFQPTAGNDILVFGQQEAARRHTQHYSKFLQLIKKVDASKFKLTLAEEFTNYDLNFVASHRAAVVFAYSVHFYRLTELYALGVPILAPSVIYFKTNGGMGKDRTLRAPYWCDDELADIKSILYHGSMDDNPNDANVISRHPSSSHPYDPNTEFDVEPEAEMYWLQYGDFYEWPHITHFDNASHLEAQLSTLDSMDVHRKMKRAYKLREQQTLHQWCQFINKLK